MKGALRAGLLLTIACAGCQHQPTTPTELPAHQHEAPAGGSPVVPPAIKPAEAGVHDVAIRNFVYDPATVSIKVGESVRWTNYDAAPHDALPYEGGWKTPLLKVNQSATQVFDTPGTYPYYCSVHPAMRGAVEVK